ncbi:hypothetical protein RB2150_06998 [Rhodobacterales bacterium HTCC2150]|nr:hypothetical protein RB2150_06998 [Rhodobacterales bacterium HTCC2150] [Rhodobacteraceae bacterium HTCC2150]
MIRYALACSQKHSFDSWFQSADAFDKLRAAGMTTCPICGDADVNKTIMAPRVSTARTKSEEPENKSAPAEHGPLSGPASAAEQMVGELKKQLKEKSEYVGEGFAAEARKIHDGEAPDRSIYGEARLDEAKKLVDDGVPVVPLPFAHKSKVN